MAARKPSLKKLGVQFEPFMVEHENNYKVHVSELYHGSPHEFAEGDVITPKTKKVAFATDSFHSARAFSKRSDEAGNEVEGNVYAVYPVDMSETWMRQMKYWKPVSNELVSPKGFRVLKKVYPN